LQKHFWWGQSHKNVAGILLQHDNTGPYTTLRAQGSNHKTSVDCPCPPATNPKFCSLRLLESSKTPSVGKGLGVMMRLLRKWRHTWHWEQYSHWYKKGTGLLFLAGTRLLELTVIM
jgi:hypothetical protein